MKAKLLFLVGCSGFLLTFSSYSAACGGCDSGCGGSSDSSSYSSSGECGFFSGANPGFDKFGNIGYYDFQAENPQYTENNTMTTDELSYTYVYSAQDYPAPVVRRGYYK